MNIVIIGTGYVGLVTGACFAEMGYHVTCLDINEEKIRNLQQGIIPIYEPGLSEMVQRNYKMHRLTFTTDYSIGIPKADICFICVPTPSSANGSCNLSYIDQAAKDLAAYLNGYTIIVNKSTAPIGTVERIERQIQNHLITGNIPFDMVSNPEFLKEGSAISDCMKPDRIIIGTNSEKAKIMMEKLYKGFTRNHDRIYCMDVRSAEMTKYAANCMLATRISFMNEMSHICSLTGADINQVRKGIGSDKRIGYSFLYAGIGYGGSCFPKDIRALIALAKEKGYKTQLLDAVETVNNTQKLHLAKQILDYFENKGGIQGKTIALWGLSFKPDTDDMRDAPSLALIQKLQAKGAYLKLYDPIALNEAKKVVIDQKNIIFCKDEKEASKNADAICLITEWKQFRLLDLNPILALMKGKAFFDGRNQYEKNEMKDKGFDYFGIGTNGPLCTGSESKIT